MVPRGLTHTTQAWKRRVICVGRLAENGCVRRTIWRRSTCLDLGFRRCRVWFPLGPWALCRRPSAQITSGEIEIASSTGGHFATRASAGKRAFLGPSREMNGNRTPHFGKPADSIAAFRPWPVSATGRREARRLPSSSSGPPAEAAPSSRRDPVVETRRFEVSAKYADLFSRFSVAYYVPCAPSITPASRRARAESGWKSAGELAPVITMLDDRLSKIDQRMPTDLPAESLMLFREIRLDCFDRSHLEPSSRLPSVQAVCAAMSPVGVWWRWKAHGSRQR